MTDRSDDPAGPNGEDRISAIVASKRSGSGVKREGEDDIPVGPLVLHQLLPVLPCPHRNHHPGGLVHGEPRYLCGYLLTLYGHSVAVTELLQCVGLK